MRFLQQVPLAGSGRCKMEKNNHKDTEKAQRPQRNIIIVYPKRQLLVKTINHSWDILNKIFRCVVADRRAAARNYKSLCGLCAFSVSLWLY